MQNFSIHSPQYALRFKSTQITEFIHTRITRKYFALDYTKTDCDARHRYKNILMREADVCGLAGGTKTKMSNIVMQLRKTAAHPYLFPGVSRNLIPVYTSSRIVVRWLFGQAPDKAETKWTSCLDLFPMTSKDILRITARFGVQVLSYRWRHER